MTVFKELVSVMQAIDLADELVALPAPDGSVSLECNDPALADSSENTVLTAARLLKEAAGVEQLRAAAVAQVHPRRGGSWRRQRGRRGGTGCPCASVERSGAA